jgi:hypothetical protein
MKRLAELSALVAFLMASSCSADQTSPDQALCAGFGGASRTDKASRLAEFYLATSSGRAGRPDHYLDCLTQQVPALEPHAVEYCAARGERGHGLIADKLFFFSHEIKAVLWDCERDAQASFMSRRDSPPYCKDVEEYLRDSLSLLAPIKSPEQLECMSQGVPRAAAQIRSACSSDSDRVSPREVLRYWDMLAAACPDSTK